jgi:hypothetical protein
MLETAIYAPGPSDLVESSPFLAEETALAAGRLAIDVTSALNSAEIGIRGYRSAKPLTRLIGAITGRNREFDAAIKADLAASQRAILDVIKWILHTENRTQYCLRNVCGYLDVVERDLGRLAVVIPELQDQVNGIEHRLSTVEWHVKRGQQMRYLQNHYEAGDLYPGAGELGRAILFVAQTRRIFAEADPDVYRDEVNSSIALVKKSLPAKAKSVSQLVFSLATECSEDVLPAVALAFREKGSIVSEATDYLLLRRLSGLNVSQQDASEAVVQSRYLFDTGSSDLRFPYEFVREAARDIADAGTTPSARQL